MKTTIELKPSLTQFPCIKCLSHGDRLPIVLFVSSTEGTILVAEPDRPQHVGKHRMDWDPKQFEIYNGKIILES